MIQCCPPDVNSHPQCYPIQVAHDDPFYGAYKEDCLNFVRTAMCPQCKLGNVFFEFVHLRSVESFFKKVSYCYRIS